jgi:hypothetical protein
MVTFRVAKAAEGGPQGWVVERLEKGSAPVVVGLLYASAAEALEDANRLNAEFSRREKRSDTPLRPEA